MGMDETDTRFPVLEPKDVTLKVVYGAKDLGSGKCTGVGFGERDLEVSFRMQKRMNGKKRKRMTGKGGGICSIPMRTNPD